MTDSVVYYIRRGDHIKIGRTTNFRHRMSPLRPDAVLAVEPGGAALETERHQQFRRHHVRDHPDGIEWFRPGPDLLEHIERTAALHDVPELPARRRPRSRPPTMLTEEDRKHLLTLAVMARVREIRHAVIDVLDRRYGMTFEQIVERLHADHHVDVHRATIARWAQPPGIDRRRRRRGDSGE